MTCITQPCALSDVAMLSTGGGVPDPPPLGDRRDPAVPLPGRVGFHLERRRLDDALKQLQLAARPVPAENRGPAGRRGDAALLR